MPNHFSVSVKDLRKINDMPHTWEDNDCHNLLSALEVDGLDGLAGEELLEMTVMALQDLGAEDAAEAVLAYKLENAVSAGVRQNIIQDMLEYDCPWEEYPNIALHQSLFAAGILLYKAFPKVFSKPDMMRLTLEIKTSQPQMRSIFSSKPEPAFVTRILADGMDENCILERLFEDQLLSNHFPEARGIIWDAEFTDVDEADDMTAQLVIYSSKSWLMHMEDVNEFASAAYNDYKISEKT